MSQGTIQASHKAVMRSSTQRKPFKLKLKVLGSGWRTHVSMNLYLRRRCRPKSSLPANEVLAEMEIQSSFEDTTRRWIESHYKCLGEPGFVA